MSVSVPIVNDGIVEGDQDFSIVLSSMSADVNAVRNTVTVTIQADNDRKLMRCCIPFLI